ncbi:hypothetical protein C2E19_05390 [Pseudomonas sp. DTU12.3]|nr:hypothetical protein C2E19_05390 [Pseudomonas sp. DTU12.3]
MFLAETSSVLAAMQAITRIPVEVSLLAMASCQSAQWRLSECFREQARSYRVIQQAQTHVKAMTSNARRIILQNLSPAL